MKSLGFEFCFRAAEISVSEVSVAAMSNLSSGLGCQYRMRLRFFPQDRIPAAAKLTFAELESAFNLKFIPALQVRLLILHSLGPRTLAPDLEQTVKVCTH